MSASSESKRDFVSSELGTKDYWDETYDREIKSFNDFGDVGEIWFGEDSQERVLDWLEDCDLVTTDDSVLDLGCGNGMMLIEMARRGYTSLTGVDYSQGAIELAKAIAEKEEITCINYQVADLIAADCTQKYTCLTRQYKIVIDKGTYDAISLIPDSEVEARQVYLKTVKHLVAENGMFVITSCNWTKEQLLHFWKTDFELFEKIPTPSFQFGGQSGNTVTSLVLKPKP
ncbi:EEF1A lysine methyltransferase 2-like [Saccostrea echinata]|uniref:EEF1A lysine methyltransferase 2-like n=1 Tax=Saccostrea echinata TaxID=191078 RepID=UPI002A83A5D2|nr:EEF1A lysine methyltransferase 2-like [Saccostrea echinata]